MCIRDRVSDIGAQAVAAEELRQHQAVMHRGTDLRMAARRAVSFAAHHQELAAAHREAGRR